MSSEVPVEATDVAFIVSPHAISSALAQSIFVGGQVYVKAPKAKSQVPSLP